MSGIHCLLHVEIEDDTVRITVRSKDGYINIFPLTDDSEVSRRYYVDYEDLDDAIELAENVSLYEDIPEEALRKINNMKIWIHPVIAVFFAYWISPELSTKVHFAMRKEDQLKMSRLMWDLLIDYPDPPKIR